MSLPAVWRPSCPSANTILSYFCCLTLIWLGAGFVAVNYGGTPTACGDAAHVYVLRRLRANCSRENLEGGDHTMHHRCHLQRNYEVLEADSGAPLLRMSKTSSATLSVRRAIARGGAAAGADAFPPSLEMRTSAWCEGGRCRWSGTLNNATLSIFELKDAPKPSGHAATDETSGPPRGIGRFLTSWDGMQAISTNRWLPGRLFYVMPPDAGAVWPLLAEAADSIAGAIHTESSEETYHVCLARPPLSTDATRAAGVRAPLASPAPHIRSAPASTRASATTPSFHDMACVLPARSRQMTLAMLVTLVVAESAQLNNGELLDLSMRFPMLLAGTAHAGQPQVSGDSWGTTTTLTPLSGRR